MEFLNLDLLPQKPRKKIKDFLKEFLARYPKKVETVILYGSLVSGNYIEGKSDINLAFVVESLSLKDLKPLVALFAKYLRQKISLPLFFTSDYIQKSLDSFPLEFLELKENHLLLYGKDIFSEVEIATENLRLQVEQILKGRLIRLRQWYLEKGLRKKELRAILKFGVKDIMPALRNLLRLKNIQPLPLKREEIIKSLNQTFNLDANFLSEIITLDFKVKDLEVYFNNLLDFLEKLTQIVDEI